MENEWWELPITDLITKCITENLKHRPTAMEARSEIMLRAGMKESSNDLDDCMGMRGSMPWMDAIFQSWDPVRCWSRGLDIWSWRQLILAALVMVCGCFNPLAYPLFAMGAITAEHRQEKIVM